MKKTSHIFRRIWMPFMAVAFAAAFLCACGGTATDVTSDGVEIKLVAQEAPEYLITPSVTECAQGGEADFSIETVPGICITGCDSMDGYEITEEGMSPGGSRNYKLHISGISHTQVISLQTRRQSVMIKYHMDMPEVVTEEEIYHLKVRTLRVDEVTVPEGYSLVGWSMDPSSGASEAVPCGSRIPINYDEDTGEPEDVDLYPILAEWTDQSCFTYENNGDGIMITGGNKSDFGERLVIPETISGKNVQGIREGAFEDVKAKELILPQGLLKIETGAFKNAAFECVYVYDDLGELSPRAFDGADSIKKLVMISSVPRVYAGSYYDAFADKMAVLSSVSDQKKIVLFSGSSARFGYDSRAIEEAFPGTTVVNMGVFAYTNAFPQLRLIENCLGADDILLLSPEFDAAQSQFCIRDTLEWHIFAMTEGDCSILSDLDLRDYSGVWQALAGYLSARRGMTALAEDVSVFGQDEDGRIADSPVYNDRGDYILYRPDATDDTPIYDLPVDYREGALPYEYYIRPFNDICKEISSKGVKIYFTYAPRNKEALSDESTKEERQKLDEYLRDNLCIPVISDIEESLYPGRYLYGTDNHLSTEGVRIRTERIIRDLMEVGS